MPPVVVCVAGAIGAVAAAKWIVREARRINAELHPERFGSIDGGVGVGPVSRLRRDGSGIYRPEY